MRSGFKLTNVLLIWYSSLFHVLVNSSKAKLLKSSAVFLVYIYCGSDPYAVFYRK